VRELRKRGCWSRWFGKLTPGSMRGSIFALMQTAVGAGILSLPYVLKSCGILVGLFLLGTGAFVAYYTMFWLIEAAFETETDNYAHVVKAKLGNKWAVSLHITFILLTFSIAALYFIVSAGFMPSILKGFNMDKETAESPETRIIIILVFLVLLFPIGLSRDLSSLAHISVIGVSSIIYVVLLIAIESPWYIRNNFDFEKLKWYNVSLTIF
jgi:sodium-coupled neutral amino acid transporter 11